MQQLPPWSKNLIINRKKRSLSQKDLAKQFGVDVKTLRSWEKGEHVPQPNFRQEISHLFEISIEDFGFLDKLVDKGEREDKYKNDNSKELSNSSSWYQKAAFLIEPALLVVVALVLEAVKRGLSQH